MKRLVLLIFLHRDMWSVFQLELAKQLEAHKNPVAELHPLFNFRDRSDEHRHIRSVMIPMCFCFVV